jgi:hypothetical protein
MTEAEKCRLILAGLGRNEAELRGALSRLLARYGPRR